MIPRSTHRPEDLRERRRSVTVCVPARDEAARIAETVDRIVAMRDAGQIDEVLVLGGASQDATDDIARARGATVVDAAAIRSDLGVVLGKGDAMWRGLHVVTTDVVAFVDADLKTDLGALVAGLVGPLVGARQAHGQSSGADVVATGGTPGAVRSVQFVKGAFRRRLPDFLTDDDPYDGGRVTETVARPLINLFREDLTGFYQPLGGQIAADVTLLRTIPFLTGYAVEIGMLLDVVDRVGLRGVVEVDVGVLENRPRTTTELAPMAQEVAYGLLSRVAPDLVSNGWKAYVRPRFDGGVDRAPAVVVERPPIEP